MYTDGHNQQPKQEAEAPGAFGLRAFLEVAAVATVSSPMNEKNTVNWRPRSPGQRCRC